MAGATSLDGTFSIGVDAGELPLRDWDQGGLSGTLQIHSVRVGPGPLSRPILGLVQQIRGAAERGGPSAAGPARELPDEWLIATDQEVRFAIRNGAVEHSRMLFQAGPVTIESTGAVGIRDEALAVDLRIRFPDQWFENRPLLARLRGEGIVVPIRGTLTQPQVEARPLLEFGRGVGLRAAEGWLQRLRERESSRRAPDPR
jgi:hypothetical protein